MDGPQQLEHVVPLLTQLIDRITPEQYDAPTPCTTFTVAGILEHMVAGATAYAPAFRGEVAPASADLEGDVRVRWRATMADLLDAVHTEGSQERTVQAPFGEVPGAVFARFVAFDGLVHGWDLARATGQEYAPPAGLVAAVDGFARQALAPEMRDGDTFKDETEAAEAATPMDRLAAFSGRSL